MINTILLITAMLIFVLSQPIVDTLCTFWRRYQGLHDLPDFKPNTGIPIRETELVPGDEVMILDKKRKKRHKIEGENVIYHEYEEI